MPPLVSLCPVPQQIFLPTTTCCIKVEHIIANNIYDLQTFISIHTINLQQSSKQMHSVSITKFRALYISFLQITKAASEVSSKFHFATYPSSIELHFKDPIACDVSQEVQIVSTTNIYIFGHKVPILSCTTLVVLDINNLGDQETHLVWLISFISLVRIIPNTND